VQSKCVARVDNYGKSPKHKITGFETPHVLRKVGRANGSFQKMNESKDAWFEHFRCDLLQKKATRHMKTTSKLPLAS